MSEPFRDARTAALAALNHGVGLNRRSGQFLGQIVGDQDNTPLSPKQRAWALKILERAGLPTLADGGVND
jgi:hypothetical protein